MIELNPKRNIGITRGMSSISHRWVISILTAVLLSVLNLNNGTAADYSPAVKEIIKRGVLNVAMYGVDTPPFFMKNKQGKLTGLDIDIAQKIAKKLGVKLRINRNFTSFDAVVDAVAKGEAIGISDLSFTDERSKRVLYSIPYMVLHHALLINRSLLGNFKNQINSSEEDFTRLFNRPEATIAVLSNSAEDFFVRRLFPKATIQPDKTMNATMEAVVSGKALAAFFDEMGIKTFLLFHSKAKENLLLQILEQEDPVYVIVPKGGEDLLALINDVLNSEPKLTPDALIDKYKGDLQEFIFNKG